MNGRISRTQVIDGVVTPAIIHNSSYFLINLQVYADGLVNCWEMVDFPLFRQKLENGWVVPAIPDGQAINIHGLGAWTIADGAWTHDASSLYELVVGLVKSLNPTMQNLHDCHGTTTTKVGNVNISIFGSPTERPVRFPAADPYRRKRVMGDHRWILLRNEDYHLVDLRIFADGTVELGGIPNPEILDIEGLRSAVAAERLVTSLPPGARVHIHGLGSFVVGEGWSVDIQEVLREIPDVIEKLNGRPDSILRCRTAYQAYLDGPSRSTRDALRAAYESVPVHNRMYVGDMDTKDIPVRMILYGDREIEDWTHRGVARARGEELPEIRVPKPVDEED